MLADPACRVDLLRVIQVFVVSLIQHDEDVARNCLQERLDVSRLKPGTGGVVGIGDKDHARARCERRAHGQEIVTEVACRNRDADRTARLCGKRIDREGVLRIHCVIARTQKRLRDQLEDIVGTVAEHDLLAFHPEAGRKRSLERVTIAIRIARDPRRGIEDRLPHLRARSARILV